MLLTLTLTDPAAGSEAVRIVRGVLADLEDITKNVAFRDLDAALAGPGGGSEEQPVGLVHFAVAASD